MRHKRLLGKSTTKKRRKRRKNREDRCESVSSWLIFIFSGCRSMRHERLLRKSVGQVSNLPTAGVWGRFPTHPAKVFAITLRHRSSFCSLKNCSFHLKA